MDWGDFMVLQPPDLFMQKRVFHESNRLKQGKKFSAGGINETNFAGLNLDCELKIPSHLAARVVL